VIVKDNDKDNVCLTIYINQFSNDEFFHVYLFACLGLLSTNTVTSSGCETGMMYWLTWGVINLKATP
jgi:hypothetical protein